MDCQVKRQTGRQHSNMQTVRQAGKHGSKHSKNVCSERRLTCQSKVSRQVDRDVSDRKREAKMGVVGGKETENNER